MKSRTLLRIKGRTVRFDGQHTLREVCTHIYGLGIYQANLVCQFIGVSPLMPCSLLTENHLDSLARFLNHSKYILESNLRVLLDSYIKQIVFSSSYRGMRHQLQLPVRGQRTRSNAKVQRKLGKYRVSFLSVGRSDSFNPSFFRSR